MAPPALREARAAPVNPWGALIALAVIAYGGAARDYLRDRRRARLIDRRLRDLAGVDEFDRMRQALRIAAETRP